MKYCVLDGSRYPDNRSRCRVCGGALVDASAVPDLPDDVVVRLSTSCCPNPACAMLVAPAKVNFCALCGVKLEPISYELWLDKFVRPAFNESAANVLLDPSFLLQPIRQMGLSGSEARNRLDVFLEEHTGAGRKVLEDWTEETTSLLENQYDREAVRQQALQRAESLKIEFRYAKAIVEALAQKIETQAPGSMPATPTADSIVESSLGSSTPPAGPSPAKLSERSVSGARDSDPLQASAKSFYRNMVSGGSVSNNLVYLNAEQKSSGVGLLDEDKVFLREVPHKQGTFVLFRGSNKQGWVFPNPRLIFRPRALMRLFPSLTKEEFNNSKPSIEPVRVIGAGKRRWQVSPFENGLRVAQTGNVTTTPHKESETSRPVDEFPISADDYLARVPDVAHIVKHDIALDKLVFGPNGKGELVLIRDPSASENTESLFVIPRIARFWSTDAFYYFYERYYDCAKPSVGDIWIIEPAVVSKVQGGWKLKKKGAMEVRSDGKTNGQEEGPSSSDPSDRVLPVTAYEEPEQVEVFIPSRSSPLLKPLPLVLAFVGIFLAISIFWSLNRSTDRTLTNANSGTVIVPSPSPTMAFIPGGEFTMGNDAGDEYEKPAHRVSVQPFFIDINEVTCEDYAKFVKATGHKTPAGWVSGTYPAGLGRRPVTGVDWDDANAYAHWAKKRLPTEEEWEFAARNGTGWKYPWGNDWIAGMANANKASKGLADVGSFKPTARGLFDMIGNAWEWTSTSIHSYPRGRIDEDQLSQAVRDKMKVIRGGCYLSDSNQATNTYRRGWPPASGPYDFAQTGFRCALDAPK